MSEQSQLDKKKVIQFLTIFKAMGFELIKSNYGQTALNTVKNDMPMVLNNDVGYMTVTVDTGYCERYPFCDNELNDKYRENALFKAQIIGTRAEIIGNYVHLDTTRCWADYIIVNGSRIGRSAFDKLRQEWEVHMDNNGLPIARISAEAYPIYIETLRRVEENDDKQ